VTERRTKSLKGKLFLPDTSAILTMMDNEEGADVVEGILRTREILLPAVVLFEVYYKTIQNRGMEIAELRYATLKSIRAKHIAELTEPVLLKGGEFKAEYQISLADSIIAAYAYLFEATLVHKDPEFEVLTMVDQVKLPYKPKQS
jgi:predicted nucleic acid-binding protein